MSNNFLTNYSEITFLEKIKNNLRTCTSFHFSVSFIKRAGLVLLLNDIKAAVARGCTGKIITSTYQNFTDIDSLNHFFKIAAEFPNFECHLDVDCFRNPKNDSTLGFHSKGYLFTFGEKTEVIVGSSNITNYALLRNIEWDLTSSEKDVYNQAFNEFSTLWEKTLPLTRDVISQYTTRLHFAIERWDMDYDLNQSKIKPNFMQRKTLKELNRYRAMGIPRALVIAAAGSGKTYLAAFDALNFNPKKLLYIVHESSILKKALSTFQQVFGNSVSYGLYTGEYKDYDADFLFATNLTMVRSLTTFAKNTFDYIVIDECHHATASSYKKILEYFTPQFLIGLTATPERMDNQDVFDLFNQNVPYELRLRDAIVNELVVPFKYYGIRDTLVNYGLNKNEEYKMVAQLATDEHAEFIREEIEKHKPAGKLKAIAFCRNISHATMMAEAMGEFYTTACLTGRNDVGERIRAYNDLQNDQSKLEILFTVDILNEGVDIPGVNMVLFLRPTESSTIFIQQLGRGLRKYPNKPYVTVLDFIGNSYKRSVQIAFALGSLSKNLVLEKPLLKSLVMNDFSALNLSESGVEIHIDDLSKEEIVNCIDQENFNSPTYLKQDYANFKDYIKSQFYPRHVDYLRNDCAPDLLRFMNVNMDGRKNKSYYNFLKKIDASGLPTFSPEQINLIDQLSEYLPLARKHEYVIFNALLNGHSDTEEIYDIVNNAIPDSSRAEFDHAVKFMQVFASIKKVNSTLSIIPPMNDQLKEFLQDLIEYGLSRYNDENGETNDFVLWHPYRMDQVQLKLLQHPNNNQRGTYYVNGMTIIFASLEKDASIEERLNYKDKFLEPTLFQWETRADVSEKEKEQLKTNEKALLFIRKVQKEGSITQPFIYVGAGHLDNPRDLSKMDPKSDKLIRTVLYDIRLENTLPEELQYDFGLTDK